MKRLFSYIRSICLFHKWENVTPEDTTSRMRMLPEGARGWCQSRYTFKCSKCGKEKSRLGDVHLGMEFY